MTILAPQKTKSTDIKQFLQLLHEPGSVFEIRSMNCPAKPGASFKATVSGYFNDFSKAAQAIKQLENCKPPAVYISLNQVDPDLLARCNNRLEFRAKHTTSGEDIVKRSWLFIDIDPKRKSGMSATSGEMQAAIDLADSIRNELQSLGWSNPLSGMSGNGAYLLYRIDLPNDDDSRDLIKSILNRLAGRFDTKTTKVDCSTFDVNRIVKVLGTTARKGDNVEHRPHRKSWFNPPDGPLEIVPVELLHEVANWKPAQTTESKNGKSTSQQARESRKSIPSVLKRASSYLAKMGPSIAGEHGHNQLLMAAGAMVRGFDLIDSEAFELLSKEFNPRCQPKWNDNEINHKISEARKDGKPFGYLLNKDAKEEFGQASSPGDPLHDLPKIADQEHRTDNANATRFIDQYGNRLRYVASWGQWVVWTGRKWCLETGADRVGKFARHYADSLWEGATKLVKSNMLSESEAKSVLSFVRQTNDASRIGNMVKLAKHDSRVSIQHTDLNSDPYLLNCRNGTFDLQSMKFREHQQEDLITQLAEVNFDPNAKCPLWDATIEMIFGGDRELIGYVQTILGYSISGDIGEAILPIAYGSGANGKSTIWNTIITLLGDYAILANESLLLGDKDGHPTEKAMLYQKRFVPIGEPERNSKLRESRTKELTGDKFITARRMKEDFWTFHRTHKFFLATNHLPKIEGSDEGIWRRVKLIPFTVDLRKVTTPDPKMADKLIDQESSGILNWLIAGWAKYQQQGFIEPMAVRKATAIYRSDSDALGIFIEENCVLEPDAIATANDLFQRYQFSGGKWSKTAFGRAMAERFTKEKPTSGEYRRQVIYHGIRLATEKDRHQEEKDSEEEKHTNSDVFEELPLVEIQQDKFEF